MARGFLSRLSQQERADLKVWLTNPAVGLGGHVDLGTACSGTDAPVLAWRAFAEAASQHLDISFEVRHLFSCERDEGKASFLGHAFPGVRIFKDVLELGGTQASTYTWGQGGDELLQEVPGPQCLAAGFPCTSLSGLNMHSTTQENRTCVSRGDLAIGSVFAGLVRFLQAHGGSSIFGLLENVLGLATPPRRGGGDSNLMHVKRLMWQELATMTKVWRLDPRDFGTPQSRGRLWMTTIPVSVMDRFGLSPASVWRHLSSIMGRLAGWPQTPIEDFLLPDSSSWLAEAHSQAVEQWAVDSGNMRLAMLAGGSDGAAKKPRTEAHHKCKWPNKHLELFRGAGLRWEASAHFDDIDLIVWPGLAGIKKRELEVLQLSGISEFPESTLRFLDCSQNVGWQQPRGDSVPAMIPRGKVYITTKCRLLHPVESLGFQSLRFADSQLKHAKLDTLQSLAGNAFEGGCCLATIVTSCAALAFGAAGRAAGLEALRPAPFSTVLADAESDEDSLFL